MSPWMEFERAHYDQLAGLSSATAAALCLAVVDHVLPEFESEVAARLGFADLALVKGILEKVQNRQSHLSNWRQCVDEIYSIYPGDDSGRCDPGGWGLLLSGVEHLLNCVEGADPALHARVSLERCYSAVRVRTLAEAMKTLGSLDYAAALQVELASPLCCETLRFIREALEQLAEPR